jgi:hypothetical protein
LRIISNILKWLSALFAPPKKDLRIVFLCLAGATMIWLLNALNKNYTTTIKCPVQYEFDNPDLVIVTPPPERIEVNVSSGGWNLLRRSLLLKRHPVILKIHNPAMSNFIRGSELTPIFKHTLVELKVNSVENDTIFFDIQKRMEKVLTGRVNRSHIRLRDNYRIVGPITIDPGEFRVDGPEKLIDTIHLVFEISIDKDEINKPFNQKIKLDLNYSEFEHFTPESVNVSFNVERYVIKELTIPVSPVNFPKDSSAYLMQTGINAKFRIRVSRAESLNPGEFRIIADYRKIDRRNSIVMIEIKTIPDYVEDFRPDTSSLKIGYGRKKKAL